MKTTISAIAIVLGMGFAAPASAQIPCLFNCPGPQGPQGEQGPAGPQGETGPAGPAGPQGETGAQGPAGPQGEQGVAGNDGAPGAQGPQGETGAQGPQGEQGIQGEQGVAGADGAQGPKGDKGDKGDKGAKGDKGDTGLAGKDGKDFDPTDLEQGLATAAALNVPHVDVGKKFAISGSAGFYNDEAAVGLGATIRLDETWQLGGSVASDVEGKNVAGKGVLTGQW